MGEIPRPAERYSRYEILGRTNHQNKREKSNIRPITYVKPAYFCLKQSTEVVPAYSNGHKSTAKAQHELAQSFHLRLNFEQWMQE